MTPRRTSNRFAVSLFAGLLLATGAGFAISACSSSTTAVATGDGTDAAADVARDTSRPAVDSATPPEGDAAPAQTQAQCLAACDAKHPNAVAKDNAIGTCWDTNCKGPCVDNPATAFDAGEAGVDAGPNPLCGTGAQSFSADCDNCTTTFCCTSWAGCFGDMDCSDYDTCLGTCSNLP